MVRMRDMMDTTHPMYVMMEKANSVSLACGRGREGEGRGRGEEWER